ncbi:transcriptional regulator FilR1 domain-containing protein [Halobaculum roseum]|uniref:Uncharacterized protein n=1 Tax=Halobaculum roseum TaxID=2175149 RepID=A0ABD5MQ13_9EURY|nr:hypothetical protein [Halobaculum roseum]QZY01940.1 hypothetical protein K6T36_11545 [Halobaculum roseum]
MNGPWGVVRELSVSHTDPDRVDLLSVLECMGGGASPTEVATECDACRKTIYRRLDEFQAIGFVVDDADTGYRTTRAGVKAIAAYRRVATQTDPTAIAYLAKSDSRRALLRALVGGAADKATLAADDQLPSRATVHRAVARLDELGWVERTADGRFTATQRGAVDLERIDWLVDAIEQTIAKAPALRTMSYWADPPLQALDGADLVVETPDAPHAMLDAAVEAAGIRDGEFHHARTIIPVCIPVLFDLFGRTTDGTARQQVIFDRRAYRDLTHPDRLQYLADAVLSSNVDVRVHPEPLYTGLTIFNRETVMVGGSTRHERNAAVVGEPDALRRWAETTFDDLWAESHLPSGRVREWLDRAGPSPLG